MPIYAGKTRQSALARPADPAAGQPPDPRLKAYRRDLADKSLQGSVEAQNFVQGVQARIIAPVADVYRQAPQKRQKQPPKRREASQAGPLHPGAATQLLYGTDVTVFERCRGYAWVQAKADSYVGYVRESDLSGAGALPAAEPSHRVTAARSFVYSEADLRAAPTQILSMGSVLSISAEKEHRGTRYALLPSGEAMIAAHLQELNYYAKDYVSVAENLLHTPYLWGGASAFGLDCSGLVQLALHMSGQQVLRDSDMQAASIGAVLADSGDPPAQLQRGDLVFWRGHVAILCDKRHIIHANGASMTVRIEPLDHAIERIARLYGKPALYRRP